MTRRNRSRGEGTVQKNEGRNRWEGRLTVGRRADGSPLPQKFTASTRAELVRKMDAARTARGQGRSTRTERRTVGQYLAWWSAEVLPGSVAPTTAVLYADVIRLYIAPHLGDRQLTTLTPGDVTNMLRALAAEGRSPNTQRLARSILRRALRRAEQEGILTRNVAAIADGVKVPRPEGITLTVAEARTFLAFITGHRLEAAYVVAMSVGLRRGELLGLTWSDVDLAGPRPSLIVQRSLKRLKGTGLVLSETKTKASRRLVRLPGPTVDALRRHRKLQREERLLVGADWPPLPLEHDLVFRTPMGTALDPDNFRQITYVLSEAAGIGRRSPHALRHSAASLLIAQGVPLKTISEVLGHSSIRITADVYGHLLDEAGMAAADAMTNALWAT